MYEHQEIKHVPLNKIRLAESNSDIHMEFNPNIGLDKVVADDIRENGILDPLLLNTEGFCTSGRRRFLSAKLIGLKTVPVIVVDGEGSDVQFSSQLGRNPTMYAKCATFGSAISKVFELGRARQRQEIDADEFQIAKNKLEALLGVKWDHIQRHWSLFEKIHAEPKDAREAEQMAKVRSIFRKMGFENAKNLWESHAGKGFAPLGDGLVDVDARDLAFEDAEVNQADWVTEEDNDFSDAPKRIRKTKHRSKPDTEETSDNLETVEIPNAEVWAKEIYKMLAGIHKKFDKYGLVSEIEEHLNGIESVAERYASETE